MYSTTHVLANDTFLIAITVIVITALLLGTIRKSPHTIQHNRILVLIPLLLLVHIGIGRVMSKVWLVAFLVLFLLPILIYAIVSACRFLFFLL